MQNYIVGCLCFDLLFILYVLDLFLMAHTEAKLMNSLDLNINCLWKEAPFLPSGEPVNFSWSWLIVVQYSRSAAVASIAS